MQVNANNGDLTMPTATAIPSAANNYNGFYDNFADSGIWAAGSKVGKAISDWWNNTGGRWFNNNSVGKLTDSVLSGNSTSGVVDFIKDGFSNSDLGNSNPSAEQSTNSAQSVGKIAYTKTGIPYDPSNIDSQINALMTEYAYERDDSSYDRLIAQLKRNGINPALVLGNAAPMSSDSGYRSNYNLTDKDQLNAALKAGSILAILFSLLMKK